MLYQLFMATFLWERGDRGIKMENEIGEEVKYESWSKTYYDHDNDHHHQDHHIWHLSSVACGVW